MKTETLHCNRRAWTIHLGALFMGFGSSTFATAGSFEDFFTAIKRDDPSEMQALYERGFDINTLNAKGQHALHLALLEPALKVAAFLATHPAAHVDVRNPQGETPLMLAVLKGHFAIAKQLAQRDADINKPDWAPLHYAATHAGPHAAEQVKWLLEQHAYIDAESPNGTTPLMMAAQYGSEEIVQLLLEEGADPSISNSLGLKALDFALRGRRPTAQELLAQALRSKRTPGQW
jgi:ankyrin repeat protein